MKSYSLPQFLEVSHLLGLWQIKGLEVWWPKGCVKSGDPEDGGFPFGVLGFEFGFLFVLIWNFMSFR